MISGTDLELLPESFIELNEDGDSKPQRFDLLHSCSSSVHDLGERDNARCLDPIIPCAGPKDLDCSLLVAHFAASEVHC
jgi:hypothetical protein